jgi:hypothetical protein
LTPEHFIYKNGNVEARMSVQALRNLLKERPFKPFRLVMSSGLAYEVRHPEMALLTKTTDN